MRPASKQQRLARSCSEFGRRSDRLRPVTGCTVSGRMVDSESTLQLSAEEFICSSHWKLLPLNQFRRCLGFGLISRLPIDNPGAWLGSGVEGRFPGTIRTRWGQRRPTLVLLTPSMYHFADRSSIQSSHHRRSGPISLSQKTFTWGAREGAFRMLTAVDFTPVSNSTEHILFRS